MKISNEKIKKCLEELVEKESTFLWDSRVWFLYTLTKTLKDRNTCPFGFYGCDIVCSNLFIKYRRYFIQDRVRIEQPCGCSVARMTNTPIEDFDYILKEMIRLLKTKEV